MARGYMLILDSGDFIPNPALLLASFDKASTSSLDIGEASISLDSSTFDFGEILKVPLARFISI